MNIDPSARKVVATVMGLGGVRGVGVFLSRKPLAPEHNAPYTYSSRSNVVMTTTLEAGTDDPICRVASIPSSVGIRMSISTMSGDSSRASHRDAPLSASATTWISSCESSVVLRPRRMSGSSSATRTRMLIGPRRCAGPEMGLHLPASCRVRIGFELASEGGGMGWGLPVVPL